MNALCAQFKIFHHNSTPYMPKMNGHEKLPFALHAYRSSIRTSTDATPCSLVYGMEAVLPVEVKIPSLQVLMEDKIEEAEWTQARYNQRNVIEEKRLKALCYGQCYQKRMAHAYDKRVKPRKFTKGDLVLKKILPFKRIHGANSNQIMRVPTSSAKYYLAGL